MLHVFSIALSDTVMKWCEIIPLNPGVSRKSSLTVRHTWCAGTHLKYTYTSRAFCFRTKLAEEDSIMKPSFKLGLCSVRVHLYH